MVVSSTLGIGRLYSLENLSLLELFTSPQSVSISPHPSPKEQVDSNNNNTSGYGLSLFCLLSKY